jgi:serine/threonine protein kinase
VEVSAARSIPPSEDLIFKDGLGERFAVRDAQGRRIHETLLIRTELSSVPSFEFALNERLWLLEKFDHPAFLTVRNIVRIPGPLFRISLVHDYASGMRLSDTLARAQSSRQRISDGATVFLLMEILDAIAELHRQHGDLSHGAIAPERILISDGRIRIADYVLGSAIEQLRFTGERYWKELRVAIPSSAGGARLDRRVDVVQVGMIALALFAGRPLNDSEHVGGVSELLRMLSLPHPMRSWLLRALHMDSRRVFVQAAEAADALREAASDAGLRPAPEDLRLQQRRSQAPPAVGRGTQPKSAPTIGLKPPVESVKPRTASIAPVILAAKPTVAAPKPARDVWQVPDAEPRAPLAGKTGIRFVQISLSPRFKRVLKVVAVLLLMTSAFTAAQFVPAPDWLFGTTGTLVVESNPQGVQVFVNGKPQGATPLTLKVEGGRHEVELRGPGKPKIFNVFVSRGDRVAQYVEFPSTR